MKIKTKVSEKDVSQVKEREGKTLRNNFDSIQNKDSAAIVMKSAPRHWRQHGS